MVQKLVRIMSRISKSQQIQKAVDGRDRVVVDYLFDEFLEEKNYNKNGVDAPTRSEIRSWLMNHGYDVRNGVAMRGGETQ